MKNIKFPILIIFILIIQFCFTNNFFIKNLHAKDTTAPKCDYTYIRDAGDPNIGEAGEIEYDKEWKKVVKNGWKLKWIYQI